MKMFRVKDLPPARPSRRLPDGTGVIIMPQPLLKCWHCGGEYSANPGDYWAANPETPLKCCGRALALVDRKVVYEPVSLTA